VLEHHHEPFLKNNVVHTIQEIFNLEIGEVELDELKMV